MSIDLEDRTARPATSEAGNGSGPGGYGAPSDASGADTTPPAEDEPRDSAVRGAAAAICTAVGAGVLAGGNFTDAEARVMAIGAALLGGLLAYGASRVRTSWLSNAVIVVGLFGVGLLAAGVVTGGDGLGDLRGLVAKAITQAHLVRPPIALTGGFAALLGWIMGAVGLVAVWTAVALRRPSVGLLLPLPVAVVAAINVSQTEQLADGAILLVLIVVGLAIASGGRELSGGREGLPLAFELRRGAKALPVLALGTAAIVGLAQTGVLFPRPVVAPQYQAQRPRTQPLSAVQDKVLFEVQSAIDGPWVVGALDVYDGQDWLLPPFADQDLVPIPASGVVDKNLQYGLQALFTIRGQTGAVLPALPNTIGILAKGPQLDYDARSGNIRLVEGEIGDGFTYRVAAAGVPSVNDLVKVTSWPAAYRPFLEIPAMPAAVRALLDKAPTTSRWAQWEYVRTWVLDNINAAGAGTPVSIPPSRVAQILTAKQASPFEIVATETMLARWAGIPARIGYGFEGGTRVGNHLEIHPKDGSVFPEVFFPAHGWIPVLGQPKHAQASVNSNPSLQQLHQGVLPSTNIAVPLFLPAVVPPQSDTTGPILTTVLLVLAALAVAGLAWLLYPVMAKALARSRQRATARAEGPRARVAQAYSEWRDLLTDYGYLHPSDTPIMLLDRFPADEDHAELAWLVTRALWGDLQDGLDVAVATDAEELSATLRRRLAQAHPITVRGVAGLSRLSLRHPHAVDDEPELVRRELPHAV